jgi:hypothetical protein
MHALSRHDYKMHAVGGLGEYLIFPESLGSIKSTIYKTKKSTSFWSSMYDISRASSIELEHASLFIIFRFILAKPFLS